MTDKVSPEQRSRVMAAERGLNTLPELYVRKRLFAAGFRLPWIFSLLERCQ
jgi:G:T-mismatch repair DNA endonuclease (very short patch repair protein)